MATADLRSTGGCFRLAGRACLRVTGADRLRYLNGQTSNDLRRLSASEALWTLVLTPRGKLCAIALAWSEEDAILLETDSVCAESLLTRLERYAISDDVAFEPIEPPLPAWHAFGPAAEGFPGRRADRLRLPGVDVASEPDLALLSPGEIERLRITQGVPRWGLDIDEDTLPQEAGLDRYAVDFDKGCYVGQETVSRLKSVGRVNRRLAGFIGDPVPDGSLLFNPGGSQVGRITSSASEGDAGFALGYLSAREEATVFSARDESGACLGRVERCEFPLVRA